MSAYIVEIYKRVPNKNPLSGASFDEVGDVLEWEVRGGFFCRSRHRSLAAAEREVERRNSLNEKYPWSPPRSEREILKAKKLGLI